MDWPSAVFYSVTVISTCVAVCTIAEEIFKTLRRD